MSGIAIEAAEEIVVCNDLGEYGAGKSENGMNLDWNTMKKKIELDSKRLF